MLRSGLASSSSETRQSEIDTRETGQNASHEKVLIEGAVQAPSALENWLSGHHVSVVEPPKTGK